MMYSEPRIILSMQNWLAGTMTSAVWRNLKSLSTLSNRIISLIWR